jgi:hypothetical protein
MRKEKSNKSTSNKRASSNKSFSKTLPLLDLCTEVDTRPDDDMPHFTGHQSLFEKFYGELSWCSDCPNYVDTLFLKQKICQLYHESIKEVLKVVILASFAPMKKSFIVTDSCLHPLVTVSRPHPLVTVSRPHPLVTGAIDYDTMMKLPESSSLHDGTRVSNKCLQLCNERPEGCIFKPGDIVVNGFKYNIYKEQGDIARTICGLMINRVSLIKEYYKWTDEDNLTPEQIRQLYYHQTSLDRYFVPDLCRLIMDYVISEK